jgi:hypothetical protein
MYLVADSALSLPVEYLQTIPKVIAAYDNDAGDELALAIQEQLPQTERMRPIAKDWNSELLARLRQQQKQKNRGIER